MKDIKDYLPYYLGCDYWTDNSQGSLNAHTLPNVIDMCKRGKNVQLHLRRLEDMTEEDCEQYNYIHSTMHSINKSQDQIKTDAEATHYLLKQGFDLFGLCDAGLAIDSKTIK